MTPAELLVAVNALPERFAFPVSTRDDKADLLALQRAVHLAGHLHSLCLYAIELEAEVTRLRNTTGDYQ
jgi:hypothetical protein